MKTAGLIGLVATLMLIAGCTGSVPAPMPQTDDFRAVVQKAKDKVFPAVVYIKCIQEDFSSGKKERQEVAGSGVIISADGEVLTNWHVVDKAVEIRCLLLDGRGMRARALGKDKDTDLALLKLEFDAAIGAAIVDGAAPTTQPTSTPTIAPAVKPLPFATLGDSDALREGDFVMAMGAPWGLNRSVSIGIVSCAQRYLPDSEYSLWIQTDASICPGNSGGPLVNTDGQIVGINTLGMMDGGDMGFAIPASTIRLVVPQLRDNGKADWSWTGLELQPIKDFNRDINFEGTDGVIVASADPDSPASQAGIQSKDRLLKINGLTVNGLREEDLPAIHRRLGMLPKNAPAKLELLRGGKSVTADLTPRRKGKVEGEELECPRWDITVKTINQFDNPDLFFYSKKGVFVFGVRGDGNAAGSGLQENDIITKIDDRAIVTLDDVRAAHADAMKGLPGKYRVVVTVLRNGLMRQLVLDYARDNEKE